MTDEKTLELLELLHELFSFGFPVYPDSHLEDGKQTVSERVEELLLLFKSRS